MLPSVHLSGYDIKINMRQDFLVFANIVSVSHDVQSKKCVHSKLAAKVVPNELVLNNSRMSEI